MFIKMMVLKLSQNLHQSTCVGGSFLIKLQAQACNFIQKETLAQVFLCEFYEIFKNSFFIDYLRRLRQLTQLYPAIKAFFQIFFGLPCIIVSRNILQKQPPEMFCKKRCSYKFCKTHRKNTCARVSFLIRFIKKETLTGVFL